MTPAVSAGAGVPAQRSAGPHSGTTGSFVVRVNPWTIWGQARMTRCVPRLTLANMEAAQLWHPRHPTLTRVIVAFTTTLIIVTGALYNVVGSSERRVDANFFVLVLAALLPAMIFAIGVKTPRAVALYGLLLLGTTVFAWFFVFVEDDAMRGVLTLPAFLFTLCASIHGALQDRRVR